MLVKRMDFLATLVSKAFLFPIFDGPTTHYEIEAG